MIMDSSKHGDRLLSQLVGQYHRLLRAYLLCSEWEEVVPRRVAAALYNLRENLRKYSLPDWSITHLAFFERKISGY